ncbi:hypothetical protein [Flavihumibacter sp. CACIAM 22H1]|uniref:hypothetical protein n=1 Tax=Flavihumibacter sp. CACIAM 22H1 TaxID=1812911 RepID=UPI0007A8E2CC|nr:hypothetical protein [Flavihumibacter sp. CACIAM 22H1]KYP15352.1 MAG: hypothetical protein A1D16_15755 [Flavihumibacter sp. CACIAM 22H1]
MKQFTTLLLSLLAFACNKSAEKDRLYLRGRLFLLDTVTNSIRYQPLASKKITLTNLSSDSLNYLYFTSTDEEGYFIFNLLADNKDDVFYLRYEDSISGYRYLGKATSKHGNDSIRMVATLDTSNLNGFIMLVKDSLNPAGNIPTATVAIYNSRLLAELNDPVGAVETITADNTGKAIRFKLPAGNYFLNAQKQVGAMVLHRIAKPVTLSAGVIIRDTIQVRKKQ